MPSTMTHAYIAKDVYKNLDTKIKRKITKDYLDNIITFSEGFDILYFYKILTKPNNKIIKLGGYCHRNKVSEFFISLTNHIKETKDINEFTFLMGLICHYVADSTIHPYVNYLASTIKHKNFTNSDAHFVIEAYLDNYFINRREDIDYTKFKLYKHVFNAKKEDSIINLLNVSFKEVYSYNNMGEIYYQGIKDMKNFFKFFRYDRFGIKNKFYKFANIIASRIFRDVRYLSYNFPLNKDELILNLDKKEWHNVQDINFKSDKSVLELYDDVIKNATEIVEKAYSYIFLDKKIDLNKLFLNKSYSNGILLK